MSEPNGNGVERVTWRDLHLWQIQPVRDVLLASAVVGLFWLGNRISVVTVPLLVAVLLAYLCEPVIRWMERRTRLHRRGAVVTLLALIVLVVVVPTLVGISLGAAQTATLLTSTARRIELVYQSVQAPGDRVLEGRVSDEAGPAWSWMRDRIADSAQRDEMDQILEMVGAWLRGSTGSLLGATASVGAGAVRSAVRVAGGVFTFAFGVFLTGFFFYFVATGWESLRVLSLRVLPESHKDRIIDLALKFDAVISGFVRGRLTIAFVQAVFFSAAYWIIGVPAALIVGPSVAVLSIVPYLALIGIPISIVLLWLEGHTGVRGQWWWVVGAPCVVYFIGQALDDYVLTPAIQGKSTNMDTPTILFASLAGGALLGVFGMLIAIPIAACVKILIVEVFWPRFREWVEGRASDPLPIEGAGE